MSRNAKRWIMALLTLAGGATLYWLEVDLFWVVVTGMVGTVLVAAIPD